MLELTETTLMDAQVARTAKRLHDIGVGLAIDDFGTGYSSMSYLKRFAVDEVKIDRSFIDGLGHDPDDATIVGAIVHMTHTLGLVDDRRRRRDHRAARRVARVGLRARAGVPLRTTGARPRPSITCWRRRSPDIDLRQLRVDTRLLTQLAVTLDVAEQRDQRADQHAEHQAGHDHARVVEPVAEHREHARTR